MTLMCVLILTGHSMMISRSAMAAAGTMVICVGADTKQIYVDADGAPTAPPHVCPECILHLAVDPAVFSVVTVPHDEMAIYFAELLAFVPRRALSQGFLSRAPPYSV
ncbi:MAG: hypothetical protein AB8B62_11945 [Roseobacter sp.]